MKKLVWVVLLAGCVSTSAPVRVGPDTYSVSSVKYAGSGRAEAIELGQDHCAGIGGTFELVDSESYPTRMGLDTTTDVTYRCD